MSQIRARVTGAAGLIGNASAAAGEPASERLFDVWNAIRLPLYYATTDMIERGQALLCKGPELFVCHPDDLDSLRERIHHRRFVHVRDRPPGQFLPPLGVGGRSG